MHGKTYTRLMNSKEWRQLRQAKLAANPLCEEHLRRGMWVAASVVHHVVEVESGRTEAECRALAFSWGNLESLCRECHAAIHRAARSHTAEVHRQRERERLEQWKSRLLAARRPPDDDGETPGGLFSEPPPAFPKSTCPNLR